VEIIRTDVSEENIPSIIMVKNQQLAITSKCQLLVTADVFPKALIFHPDEGGDTSR
jgi:hypothetical protein